MMTTCTESGKGLVKQLGLRKVEEDVLPEIIQFGLAQKRWVEGGSLRAAYGKRQYPLEARRNKAIEALHRKLPDPVRFTEVVNKLRDISVHDLRAGARGQ